MFHIPEEGSEAYQRLHSCRERLERAFGGEAKLFAPLPPPSRWARLRRPSTMRKINHHSMAQGKAMKIVPDGSSAGECLEFFGFERNEEFALAFCIRRV